MGINVKTGPMVASYAYVWKARKNKQGKLKFSCCCLFSKANKDDILMYNKAIKAAFDEGVAKGMFPATMWEVVKKPLRDGDAEVKTGIKKPGIGYEGCMFLNANADGDPNSEYFSPPEITKPLNGKVVAITDQSEFYSGCECRAALSFYSFKTPESRGIAVGLNALFKTGDGTRLDGRESAESAFSDFAAETGNLDSDKAEVEVVEDVATSSKDPFGG
ncbi:MAG: hypothetical protein DRP01_08725 [Archaeoglobales archaeon]|nr:MAG: hypothetical protein DRP01_08725 [Archaeoglobales archaeon]